MASGGAQGPSAAGRACSGAEVSAAACLQSAFCLLCHRQRQLCAWWGSSGNLHVVNSTHRIAVAAEKAQARCSDSGGGRGAVGALMLGRGHGGSGAVNQAHCCAFKFDYAFERSSRLTLLLASQKGNCGLHCTLPAHCVCKILHRTAAGAPIAILILAQHQCCAPSNSQN